MTMVCSILFAIHIIAIFIFVVAMFSCLLLYIEDDWLSLKCCMQATIFLVVVVVLSVFLILGWDLCKQSKGVESSEPYAVEKIVSLNDNNMTNGRMYLRRGYISSDLYYQYMVDVGNGGFVANKIKSNNATLYYTKDNFRVEWYTKTQRWLYFTHTSSFCRIYVPEGSIVNDYSVDLE